MKIHCKILLFCFLHQHVNAQIGVGTSSVDPSARLQVDATSGTNDNPKGFLPPRVALSAINTIAPFSSITPATGLLVYNTATAGTAPNNVTPGFYYYDGVRWQRVINTQDAIVSFNTADPNAGSPTFTDGPATSSNYIYVSSVNNSQWTWNGTAYVTYNPPASTAWFGQSSTTDAGSNKTSGIYRTGNVGIGTASFTPTTKLDIRASTSGTGFRLVDGSQGANKVLQSDANGNGSWATNVAITPAVIGTMGVGGQNSGAFAYTGASITLPNGKWSISVSMLVITSTAVGSYWLRTGFSGSTDPNGIGADGIGPSLVSGLVWSNKYNMITGTVIINNTSGANKTYYYVTNAIEAYDGGSTSATFVNLGRNTVGENSIIAYPMN